MMENEQEDPIHPATLTPDPPQPLLPQFLSIRRQLPEDIEHPLQYTVSEESNEHPFAPQIPKSLPPKYLKPIGKLAKSSNRKQARKQHDEFTPQLLSQTGTDVLTWKPQDSVSTGDSGKSTLSEVSSDCQEKKSPRVSPRKKPGKSNVKLEPSQDVFQDDVLLLRKHLMDVLSPKTDNSASIYAYLTVDKVYISQDIVLLTPQRTEDDPCNTAYTETKLESKANIFRENGISYNRIFIQGDAGSGKSTLLRKITQDWMRAQEKAEKQGGEKLNPYELTLVKFSLLFHVPLGYISDEKKVEDVLRKYVIGKDCPIDGKRLMDIIREHQSSVLFLLDGFEEYSDASAAVDELLSETAFPNITVILTSQSWKLLLPKMTGVYDRLLELKGFGIDGAQKLISKFINSKKHNISETVINETEFFNCIEAVDEGIRRNPLLLVFLCTSWLEKTLISTNRSEIFKDMLQCLYDIYKREEGSKGKIDKSETDINSEPTLQAFLVNIGKIAFRCLLSRKQCPKRVPSHWFDQPMYRGYLLLGLELGVLQEIKIVHKQKLLPVAAFVSKSVEEFLAAYYLCNVNDASIVFHEQAAIIELINAGKIEKAFVYKFLDILIFAAGINPLIACELLTILVPEMESDCIVMEKLNKCAAEMNLNDDLKLPLRCLKFDKNVSQSLIMLCKESLEYLSCVNCQLRMVNSNLDSDAGEEKQTHSQMLSIPTEKLQSLKFLKLDHVIFHTTTLKAMDLPKLEEIAIRAVSPVDKCLVEILTKVKSPILQELTIDYCDFSDNVLCFPRVDSLNTLNLGNLKLCASGWKTLLQSIENIPNLKSLVCQSLKINGECVVLPRLKYLSRLELHSVEFESENNCTDFYASFQNFKSLEMLEISEMCVSKLFPNLGVLPNLKRMSLNKIIFSSEIAFPKSSVHNLELNHLTFVDHCGQNFISSMNNLPNLSSVAIRFCNFEKENINFLKLKSVKKVQLMQNTMTSNCWCVSVFSLGQLENIETLEVVYTTDEETNVGALIEDMVDQRSPVPKIVSYTKSRKEKSVTVDFTNKESLMKTGSCCMQ